MIILSLFFSHNRYILKIVVLQKEIFLSNIIKKNKRGLLEFKILDNDECFNDKIFTSC